MKIAVFSGPSLPHDRSMVGVDWFGPARAGDLLSLSESGYNRICLIDGLFDHVPSPWHKEILTLLAQGIRMYGAASMGALRAAELQPFGMVGVGAIFQAYRDRRLVADDEVALIHCPERLQWAPLSVPMVEFRATLQSAVRCHVVTAQGAKTLRAAIHAIHFVDRDWRAIYKVAQSNALATRAQLDWMQSNHVPLKRMDAVQCVAHALADHGPRLPQLNVPETCFLRDLRAELQSSRASFPAS